MRILQISLRKTVFKQITAGRKGIFTEFLSEHNLCNHLTVHEFVGIEQKTSSVFAGTTHSA